MLNIISERRRAHLVGKGWEILRRRGDDVGDAALVVDEADLVGVELLLLGDGGVGVGEIVTVGELDGISR
jgi:hypothetical protein